MIFEGTDIFEYKNFLSPRENAKLLHAIMDKRPLWEKRSDRVDSYKNAEWYTLGSAMYLDLKSVDNWMEYKIKKNYFNGLLDNEFNDLWDALIAKLNSHTGEKFELANALDAVFALPGFHIFPPHMAAAEFFGRKHRDMQWEAFRLYPGLGDIAAGMTDHFSGTYCLTIPKQGPHLLYGSLLEENVTYEERTMYLHSGQFEHAIAPLQRPISQFDWRITLQFHGFKFNNINYIYW